MAVTAVRKVVVLLRPCLFASMRIDGKVGTKVASITQIIEGSHEARRLKIGARSPSATEMTSTPTPANWVNVM